MINFDKRNLKIWLKSILPVMEFRRFRAFNETKKTFEYHYPLRCAIEIEGLKKTVIYVANGIHYAGGLSDRFRGMVSLYKLSKLNGFSFKIHMMSPFSLDEFLLPNQYNWHVNGEEISYHPKQTIAYQQWSGRLSVHAQRMEAEEVLKCFLQKYDQIHYSTNIYVADDEYGDLFNELFKPSPRLKREIDWNLTRIGKEYISVTFRFQQLLGDFIEGDYPILSNEEQEKLIDDCINQLKVIYRQNEYEKVLVTSDSSKFLKVVNPLGFIYTIPGELAHMEYSLDKGNEVYMKSFIDYFMLTKSNKVYLVIGGYMYDSGFPKRAALHGKVPFETLRF